MVLKFNLRNRDFGIRMISVYSRECLMQSQKVHVLLLELRTQHILI